jgi:hypothetical protein
MVTYHAPLLPQLRKGKKEEEMSYHDRLIEFYKKYVPAQLESVDDHLRQYKGHESLFLEALVK